MVLSVLSNVISPLVDFFAVPITRGKYKNQVATPTYRKKLQLHNIYVPSYFSDALNLPDDENDDCFCLKPEVKDLDGSLSGVDKSLLLLLRLNGSLK